MFVQIPLSFPDNFVISLPFIIFCPCNFSPRSFFSCINHLFPHPNPLRSVEHRVELTHLCHLQSRNQRSAKPKPVHESLDSLLYFSSLAGRGAGGRGQEDGKESESTESAGSALSGEPTKLLRDKTNISTLPFPFSKRLFQFIPFC